MKNKTKILFVALLILGIFCNTYSHKLMQITGGAGSYNAAALVTPKYGDTRHNFVHWESATTIPISTNQNGAGDGITATDTKTVVMTATQAWQNVSTAYINFSDANFTSHTLNSADGLNTVYWAEAGDPAWGVWLVPDDPDYSPMAITVVTVNANQELLDVDIIMNGRDIVWKIGSDYDIQSTVTHELGHLLGIQHSDLDMWDGGVTCSSASNSAVPTMYAGYIGLDKRSLEADDKEAVTFLYPQSTFTPPATPTLNTPANNESNVLTGPVPLNWNAVSGATSYYIEVFSDWQGHVINKSGITGTTIPATDLYTWGFPPVLIDALQPNTMYTWRVTAYNNGFPGPTSERTFTTASPGPAIIWPPPTINNASTEFQPRTFTLYWNGFQAASRYHVQVAPYCPMGSQISLSSPMVIDDPNVTGTSKQITLDAGVYYWRVRAVDDPSDWTYAVVAGRLQPNAVISHDATWYGSVGFPENTTVNSGIKLTILSGTTMTIPSGISLTVNGTVEMQGNVTIAGGGNLVIGSTGTLNVLPGAVVQFANNISLTINGTLTANGTSSQPITFDRSGTSGTWGGILFQANSPGGSLNYCNISHATYGVYAVNSGGLYTFHVEPTIQNCTITNNSYGIYYDNCGIINSNPIQYNTISNNSAHGIYLNTSWPLSIDSNTISGNGGDGICMNNCNGNIIGNTISYNWGNGIYCYNHSAPQIRNNVFRLNGWGVHCDYYSPANLGSSFTDYGHNVFHESNASIMATGLSNVIAGDYDGYGLNSFYSDQLVMNHLWIDNSIVEADYDYWEGMDRPDAYIINGGRLDYTTVLDYDPNANEGMGKIVTSNSPASNGLSKITGVKSVACDTSAFLDADLRRCLDAMLSGKYEEAIHQYSRIYKKEKDPVKKQYILTQIATCYSRANKNNFVKFLNSDVRPNLSKDDRLYAVTLELENFFLIQDGKYDPAITNFDTLTSRFTTDTATVKHALFGLWSLYFHDLKNAEKAKGYLDELKAKFPKDDLTRHAMLLAGEIDSSLTTGRAEKNSQLAKIVKPTNIELQANYPNPFNPSTVISYQLPNVGTRFIVSLKIYDMLGREVATLVNGMKEPGYYTANFDGSHLSSGIYFARFSATPQDGNQPFVKTMKMLMVK
ncbi:MAG: right-handed parallel beta-helix repeat-containing protein [Bacteroidota bacterium]